MWRMIGVMQRVAGVGMLKQDRERLDLMSMVERLVEKLYEPERVDHHCAERDRLRVMDREARLAAIQDNGRAAAEQSEPSIDLGDRLEDASYQ